MHQFAGEHRIEWQAGMLGKRDDAGHARIGESRYGDFALELSDALDTILPRHHLAPDRHQLEAVGIVELASRPAGGQKSIERLAKNLARRDPCTLAGNDGLDDRNCARIPISKEA